MVSTTEYWCVLETGEGRPETVARAGGHMAYGDPYFGCLPRWPFWNGKGDEAGKTSKPIPIIELVCSSLVTD